MSRAFAPPASHIAKYRSDVDGLRAIAVLSVMIFHINAAWLPGGYLGVDIFFVISGYLITSILYREVSDGTFSFASFYTKRIKRILPAFFVTTLVAMLLAYGTMLAEDARLVGRSALAGVFFIANILFARRGGYFDARSEEQLLKHLWSLSVEEQFYFLFPTLLIALLYFRRLRPYIIGILSVLGGSVLLTSGVQFPYRDTILDVYYLPHLRFVEMLVGAVLAIAIAQGKLRHIRGLSLWLVLSVGALLGCFALGAHFKPPYFPGVLALVPCLATALILYPSDKPTFVSRALSWSPLVWVGKISYSLYLWHWIVLAYVRYMGDPLSPLSPTMVLFCVVLMFALSALSYYLVEQPLRHMKFSFTHSVIGLYVAPAVVCVGLFYYGSNYPQSLQYPAEVVEFAPTLDEIKASGRIDLAVGDSTAQANVYIVGDSHCLALTNFWDAIGKHEGWQALLSATGGGPFFKDLTFDWNTKQFSDEVGDRWRYLEEHIDEFETIIIANYWGAKQYSLEPERYHAALERTIDYLTKHNKQIILVNSNYRVGSLHMRRANAPRVSAFLDWVGQAESVTRGASYYASRASADAVRALVQKYPTLGWVDLEPHLPESGQVDGTPIYADKDHINMYAARWQAEQFIRRGDRLIKP